MATVNVLRLRHLPIFKQLHIEEALFRATDENWFIVNDGTPEPAVVLGISGYAERMGTGGGGREGGGGEFLRRAATDAGAIARRAATDAEGSRDVQR